MSPRERLTTAHERLEVAIATLERAYIRSDDTARCTGMGSDRWHRAQLEVEEAERKRDEARDLHALAVSAFLLRADAEPPAASALGGVG